MAEMGTSLTRVDPTAWRIACEREPVIRALAAERRLGRGAVNDAGTMLGLNRSRIYELVARYRNDPVTSSLVDQHTGFPKGQSRLKPDVERVIDHEIEQFYLSRPKPTLAQLVRQIRYACQHENLRPPTRPTIVLRVAAIERKRLFRERDGAKAAADRFRPVLTSFEADYPLQVVQMDHTPADIIIVDELSADKVYVTAGLCRGVAVPKLMAW